MATRLERVFGSTPSDEPQLSEYTERSMSDRPPVRALVVGGQQIIRSGLMSILRDGDGIGWVGEASSSDAAIRATAAGGIDVVVLDHCPSPNADGPGLARRLARDHKMGVVIVTETSESELLLRYLHAGARGLVSRVASAAHLIAAVQCVASGDAMLSPSITRNVIEATVGHLPAPPPPPGLDKLTRREMEILLLVADGLSNAEIAAALHVSYKTVKFHVSNILRKLSVQNRAQAIVRVIQKSGPRIREAV